MNKTDFFYKLGYEMTKVAKKEESALPSINQIIGSGLLGSVGAVSAFKAGLPKSKILAAGLVPAGLGLLSTPLFNTSTPTRSEILMPFLSSKEKKSKRLIRGLAGSALLGAGSAGALTLPEILAKGISGENIKGLAGKGALGFGLGAALPALATLYLNK